MEASVPDLNALTTYTLHAGNAIDAPRINGTFAAAQQAARALSKAAGAGVCIRLAGQLMAYLNTSKPEPAGLFPR